MTEFLRFKTVNGVKWSFASTISIALMQVGYTGVMARLLNPSDFGLVAMGSVVLTFGGHFAQMGMGSAIIQRKQLTKEQLNAAFTSSILLGLIFTILVILLAPLAKYVFSNIAIIPLMRIMAFSFFINGFSLTPLALVRRALDFKSLAVAEIISFVFGYIVVGIGSALNNAGVWSLVLATLSQNIILAILIYSTVKPNFKLTFTWEAYKALFSFGSKISAISLLEYFGSSLDTIAIGRVYGTGILGIYNRSQMLINLPMQYFTSSISRVLFPSFSKIQEDDERIKKTIIFILQLVAIILFPFAILITVLAKEIVLFLLGARWLEVIPLLKILSFAAAINLLTHFIGVLFEAKGLLRQKILIQCTYIILLASLFYFATGSGIIGFAAVLLLAQTLKLLSYLYYFLKEYDSNFREVGNIFIKPGIISLLILVPTTLLYYFFKFTQIPSYVTVFMVVITTALIYIVFFSLKDNASLKERLLSYLQR